MHCASSPSAAARAVFLARDRRPVDVGVEEAVFTSAHLQAAARIVPRAVVFLHALHLALHRPGRDSAGEEADDRGDQRRAGRYVLHGLLFALYNSVAAVVVIGVTVSGLFKKCSAIGNVAPDSSCPIIYTAARSLQIFFKMRTEIVFSPVIGKGYRSVAFCHNRYSRKNHPRIPRRFSRQDFLRLQQPRRRRISRSPRPPYG